MVIKTKIFFTEGKKESSNDFEFTLNKNMPIQRHENPERCIIFLHGNPYTINEPFNRIKKLKENIS